MKFVESGISCGTFCAFRQSCMFMVAVHVPKTGCTLPQLHMPALVAFEILEHPKWTEASFRIHIKVNRQI